ncbi:MAG: helix-hairpin-helix domain-containing protein [Planctomycetes bacterium]|nr:helix-hairpin-helix domain-containing protein [Planctomycetota bacterium]
MPTLCLAAPKPVDAKSEKAAEKAADKVDLNHATDKGLQELPGIGPATAKKIVGGRPYKSIDDLSKAGLSAAEISKIRPLVTVTAKPAHASSTPPKKGMVWVNTDSKVYHKEGSRWYGKTKQGKWLTEPDAIKAGFTASKEKE